MPCLFAGGSMPLKSLFCPVIMINKWRLLNTTVTLTVTMSARTMIKLFSNEFSRWIWHDAKDECVEKHLMPTVRYRGGYVML